MTPTRTLRWARLGAAVLAAIGLYSAAPRAQAPRLFLYTSGVWIYGNRGEERITEASPIRPPRIAAVRAEHERLVLAADRGALRTMVIRPGCVYGGSAHRRSPTSVPICTYIHPLLTTENQ